MKMMITGRMISRSILFTIASAFQTSGQAADVPDKFTPEQIGWQSFPLQPDKTLEYKTVTGKDGVPVNLKLQAKQPASIDQQTIQIAPMTAIKRN